MIRFGIVGAGGIAKKFASDLKLVEHAKLTAVSARSNEKADNYKTYYGCEYAFGSYEEMAKSDVIDAVYIATPHRFHKEHAILFMHHNKHVLVEKPVSVNAKEFADMMEVAKTHKVLLMEAMWTHFLPATTYIVDQIKAHKFGKLLHAKLKFGFPIIPFTKKEGRILNPLLAGGSLLDLGIYPVSFMHWIVDQEIKDIKTKTKFTKSGVDKKGTIYITLKDNAEIQIKHSIASILGDHAILTFEKARIVMPKFHGNELFSINGKWEKRKHLGGGFVHEIQSFVHDIEMGFFEDPVMTHKKSLKTMKLMDTIREEMPLKYPFES